MDWMVLAGSFIAIFAVATLVHYLKLGENSIRDEAHARKLAEDNLSGFDAEWAVVSSDGDAAITKGQSNTAALIKRHGAQFALREVALPLQLVEDGSAYMIDSGELSFGRVSLRLMKQDADKLLTLV